MIPAKKLLVIDDEFSVREAVSDILEIVNVEVLQAHHGEMGIQLLRQHINEIGAVLLDIRLPGMDGPEVLAIIRQIDPSLTVIASSGYSTERAQLTFGNQQPDRFLSKPYDIGTLIDTITQALASSNP